MTSVIKAAAVALALGATAAHAGGLAEPLMEAEPMMEADVIVAETAGTSAGGIIVPLLLLAILAAAAASSGGGSTGPA